MGATLKCACFALLCGVAVSPLSGQPAVELQVTLERLGRAGWTALDPHLVLRGGDKVRFRFRSNRAGFLYVINLDATGRQSWLFPTGDTGRRNNVEPRVQYTIPATGGAFEIAARPGYETTYWILSPIELQGKPGFEPPPPPEVQKMDEAPLLPRCDDGPLTARGPCMDRNAGARRFEARQTPDWFDTATPLEPRDLAVDDRKQSSRIRVVTEFSAPFIYEYRIGHR